MCFFRFFRFSFFDTRVDILICTQLCNLCEIPIFEWCLFVRACLRSEHFITFFTFCRGCGGDDDDDDDDGRIFSVFLRLRTELVQIHVHKIQDTHKRVKISFGGRKRKSVP